MTLFELLLVMLILSLFAGMVTGFFQPSLFGSRMEEATNNIVAAVAQARTQAQLVGKPFFLYVDIERNTIFLLPEQAREGENRNEPERPLHRPLGVTIRGAQLDGKPAKSSGVLQLRFDPSGFTLPAVIWTEDGDQGRSHFIPAFNASTRVESHILNLELLKSQP